MSPAQLRQKLLAEHPEYCTTADVARMLGCDKRNVRHYAKHIPTKTVEGMLLFHRGTAIRFASVHTRELDKIGRLGVTGADVERLRKICEVYYRTQYDIARPEHLKLAKRLAQL